jgi:hypothetical protein
LQGIQVQIEPERDDEEVVRGAGEEEEWKRAIPSPTGNCVRRGDFGCRDPGMTIVLAEILGVGEGSDPLLIQLRELETSISL